MQETNLDIHFWIRLHPGEKRSIKKIKKYLIDNKVSSFYLEEATELPLYALLRNIDIHITDVSSVVIEAELFGVPSIIIDALATEYYKQQIERKMAYPCYSVDKLNGLLISLSKDKKQFTRTSSPLKEENKLLEILKNKKKEVLKC